MSLRLITAPTEYPITLAQGKEAAKVDGSGDDSLVTTYIAAATSFVESYTGRALMEQTWELVLDDFADSIMIPKGPVQSITSVKYYDTDSALQTLDTTDYVLDNVSDPAWLVRPTDVTYPDVAEGVNNVIIRFVAGYTDIPGVITAALMTLVAFFYDNRSSGTIPDPVYNLLANHRSFAS